MIVYQVYPRSFQDSNGDGIGDLPGVVARLDYIRALGVDVVWLGPVFRSPMRDVGYDVADYRSIDPSYGTLDDFRTLVREARARGLGVLVDMPISHTSDRHPWFEASRRREGPTADWYRWADAAADGTPPNNWLSVFGGPAWRWDALRRQYYFHSFLSSQPDLDFNRPDVQARLLGELAFWLDEGIAGFRLDACNHYFQDRRLRDNPAGPRTGATLHPYGFQRHLYDKNRPDVLPFLERVRALVDRYDAWTVGEVGGSDALRLMVQYTRPGRLHATYNRDFLRPDGTAAFIRRVLRALQRHLVRPGAVCHTLSNHDKPRVVTRWGEGREPKPHAKQMLALLACLDGPISVYQGEELGLPEADVPFERLQDPYGIAFWPTFKGRDGCRTPMPWTADAPHAGFSSSEPWLPVDSRHRSLAVSLQQQDPDSVLAFARTLFALRRRTPALDGGTLRLLPGGPTDVLAFVREHAQGALACVFNLGREALAYRGAFDGEPLLAQRAARDGARLALDPSGFWIGPIADG